MRFYAVLHEIYRPKYVAITFVLGIAYAFAFWCLAYIQGGNAVMRSVPIYLIFLLIASSSILMTIAIYSIRNMRKNGAKTGTAASAGTVILGSGLCGCTTALLPTVALAVGLSAPATYALTSFLSNYSIEIVSLLIALNVVVIVYYLNKLSNPMRRLRK